MEMSEESDYITYTRNHPTEDDELEWARRKEAWLFATKEFLEVLKEYNFEDDEFAKHIEAAYSYIRNW